MAICKKIPYFEFDDVINNRKDLNEHTRVETIKRNDGKI